MCDSPTILFLNKISKRSFCSTVTLVQSPPASPLSQASIPRPRPPVPQSLTRRLVHRPVLHDCLRHTLLNHALPLTSCSRKSVSLCCNHDAKVSDAVFPDCGRILIPALFVPASLSILRLVMGAVGRRKELWTGEDLLGIELS